jgi:putative hemolysin
MAISALESRIFSLIPGPAAGWKGAWLAAAARPLESLLGLGECERIYAAHGAQSDPLKFIRAVLGALEVRAETTAAERENIPARGPVVVVANHPFGGIEGLLLAELLLSVRSDVKLLVNYMLNRIPQLRPLAIPVDPFGRTHSARANLGALRQAVRWVQGGGLLMVFPAGEVSHLKLATREVTDPAWSPAAGAVVRRAQAAVVPVFIRGRNRARFQAAGLVHPRLRTALLARELLHKRGAVIPMKIGAPIPHRWLQHYGDDRRLTEYLRWRTYILGCAPKPARRPPARPGRPAAARMAPLAAAEDPQRLKREIARLPAAQRLAQSGGFAVWLATAGQIPRCLREIGRLREISFRAAAEGTGRALDLDRFDDLYLHLFVIHEAAGEIVGAYRLGPTDQIIARHGPEGLYTSTLFHSRREFFQAIGPALEMGRSFIRPEYQKSYSALLLLWKGIGGFIARNPRYRFLFGPVSISRDYSDLTRRLIATTLLAHSQAKDLALMVRPRRPVRLKPIRVPGCGLIAPDAWFQDFKEVCGLIGDIEFQNKEVPVLLRHYLNLGGQLLAFNIDRSFGDVMDGLILVDLLRTDRKTLQRYMGPEGLAALLGHHARGGGEAAEAVDGSA